MVENNPPAPLDLARPPVIPLPTALYVSGELIFELYERGTDQTQIFDSLGQVGSTKENEPEAVSPQTVLRTRQD